MYLHFFTDKKGKKITLSEHLACYILSLLDPQSQINAAKVSPQWGQIVSLTQRYQNLLPTLQKIPMYQTIGLDVLRLKIVTGGMTNTTYRVAIGPDIQKRLQEIAHLQHRTLKKSDFARYKRQVSIVRVPGDVSLFAVNREHELHNAMLASERGVNVPIEFFDGKSGLQVTQCIENLKPLDAAQLERQEVLIALAIVAKCLHQSGQFINDTDVFVRNNNLLAALEQKNFSFPEEVSEIKEKMDFLQNLFATYEIEKRPCHNDPTPSNYLLSLDEQQNEMYYQIDWEYSSNNDFLWDLAYFAIEAKLSPAQELIYLGAYFGAAHLNDTIKAWYKMYKPIVEWWITLWSWTQIANQASAVNVSEYAVLAESRYQKTLMHLEGLDFQKAILLIEDKRSQYFPITPRFF